MRNEIKQYLKDHIYIKANRKMQPFRVELVHKKHLVAEKIKTIEKEFE